MIILEENKEYTFKKIGYICNQLELLRMKKYTIEELQLQRESEDHVEFKKAENGTFSYNGANKAAPKERRKCILGYVLHYAMKTVVDWFWECMMRIHIRLSAQLNRQMQ